MGQRGAAEFRRRAAGVADGTGAQQPVDEDFALLGNIVLEDQRARGHALALEARLVLDHQRQALERARPGAALHVLGLGLAGLAQGLLVVGVGEGVNLGLDRLRARDLRLQQLDRRQLAAPEQLQGLGRREITELRGHGSPSPFFVLCPPSQYDGGEPVQGDRDRRQAPSRR
jgi:hypothetical protein